MRYYFPILILIVIAISGCVSLPPTGGPECNVDSDCDDFSGARICNLDGKCETCPDPQCVELPPNCIYIPDDSTRCPECGTVDCIKTEPAPTCRDNIKNQGETDVDCGGPSCQPCIAPPPELDFLPAFPGAEGFGAATRGAYALYEKTGNPSDLPEIYHVTSLSGGNSQGMLGHAMRMQGPRLIVFDVGGTISLNGNIPAKSPYVTIAGHTAPGEGIMIKNSALTFHDSEVIVRGLRILNGDDTTVTFSPSNRDAITLAFASTKSVFPPLANRRPSPK